MARTFPPALAVVTVVLLGWCGVAEGTATTTTTSIIGGGGGMHMMLINKQVCQGLGVRHIPRQGRQGVIASPKYHGRTSCHWVIFNPQQETLVMSFSMFDLRAGHCGTSGDACCGQWVKISSQGQGQASSPRNIGRRNRHSVFPRTPQSLDTTGDSVHRLMLSSPQGLDIPLGSFGEEVNTGELCGSNMPLPISTKASRVDITFYSEVMYSSQHGFRLHYYARSNRTIPCSPDEFTCVLSNQCIPKEYRCNHHHECPDQSDEVNCEEAKGKKSHRCKHMFPCAEGGCYVAIERCDGSQDCSDGSDEVACTQDLCNANHGTFLCNNGRCIRETWRCDQLDDCQDGSDEQDCLRNSVIGVAAMGGLVCSLLVVVAVGCTGRLYALRMGITRMQTRTHGVGGATRGSSTTPRSRLEEHLLQREPPPSYDVAVNDRSTLLFGSCMDWQWRRQCRQPSGPQNRAASSPLSSPRLPAYGSPQHAPHGLTVEIHGGRRLLEKEGEEGNKMGTFPCPEGVEAAQEDMPLLTSLVEDCIGDDLDDDGDVPLLLELNTSFTSSSDADSDHEGMGSLNERSKEDQEQEEEHKGVTTHPALPSHPTSSPGCNGTSLGDDISVSLLCDTEGDVISDTRAAALALSAVQWHTEEVTQKDTELMTQ